MNTDRLETVLAWFARSRLETLEIVDGSGTIILRAPQDTTAADTVSSPAADTTAPGFEGPPSDELSIPSPLYGVCYLAPRPDAPAFVAEGTRVAAGDPICVVEAMKVMNTITAPTGGILRRIVAQDGHEVEEGEPLMILAPLPASEAGA